MIDHVLGRPSVKSRRLQVLAVLGLWTVILLRGHRHGPPGARSLSRFLTRRLTAWQAVLITLIYAYAIRNISTLVGLAAPEPLATLYDAVYFRATWVMTAMDAGFWTAMRIRSRRLRDAASMIFTLYYLFAADRADEKVRKVRGALTVEHLRVSWNKGTTPYLNFLSRLVRPSLTRWPPRAIRILRPAASDYRDPVSAWLYYDGPVADLAAHDRVILDIPGGGFVAMNPRCHDDRLLSWTSRTGLPVLSLDYHKAPEFPYPYALNECFDVYMTVIGTRGKCIGFSGQRPPRIVVAGDSAGGNLATAMTLMVIERNLERGRRGGGGSGSPALPLPDGLMLAYPSLDMNIGNWMTDEQMSLIRDRRMRRTNRPIVRRKSMQYASLVGTPHHSDREDEGEGLQKSPRAQKMAEQNHDWRVRSTAAGPTKAFEPNSMPHPEFSHVGPTLLSPPSATDAAVGSADANSAQLPLNYEPAQRSATAATTRAATAVSSTSHHPEPLRTRLATSSMISYFNDRVLTPEMMRAMIILYIGPHNRPDFSSEYLLSPVLAPDGLLEHFPRAFFLTGERDPLVDDTVIFAGRLRRAKEAAWARTQVQRTGREESKAGIRFDEKDVAEVTLIPGISHGFLQVPQLYPPTWRWFDRCAVWIGDMFARAEKARARACEAEETRNSRVREKAAAVAAAAEQEDKSRSVPVTDGGGLHHTRTESSGDEERPLEISMTKLNRAKTTTSGMNRQSTGNGNNSAARHGQLAGASRQSTSTDRRRAAMHGIGRTMRNGGSLVKLASSDDLLGRRMQGLAGGLTKLEDDELDMY